MMSTKRRDPRTARIEQYERTLQSPVLKNTGQLEGRILHLLCTTYTQSLTEQIRQNVYMKNTCRGHKYGAAAGSPRGRELPPHSELSTVFSLIHPPPERFKVPGRPRHKPDHETSDGQLKNGFTIPGKPRHKNYRETLNSCPLASRVESRYWAHHATKLTMRHSLNSCVCLPNDYTILIIITWVVSLVRLHKIFTHVQSRQTLPREIISAL